jgi:hypothetical protein
VQATTAHVEGFAHFGLRTLVVGMRTIPADQLVDWRARIIAATTQMTDRDVCFFWRRVSLLTDV